MTDEVRCPMCGKPNPAEAEVCEFCQARLKPLILSPEPSEGSSDVPDWLRSLRSMQPPEESSLVPEDDTSSGSQDWFDSPGEQEPEELPAPPPASLEPEARLDWLAGLGEEETPAEDLSASLATPEAEASGSEDLGSLSDWLASLKGEEAAEVQEAPAAEEPAVVEEETQLPDEAGVAEPEEAASQEQVSFDEWLSKSEIEAPAPIEWPGSDEIPAPPTGAEETAETEAPAAAGELPDWLSALTGEIPEDILKPITTDAGEEAVPAELPEQVEAGALEPSPVEPELPAPPAEELQVLPEWLSQIDRSQEAAAGSVPAFTMDEDLAQLEPGEQSALEEATAEALSLPDWIAELSAEAPAEPPEAASGLEAEPDLAHARLPDWLEAMRPVEAVAPDATFLDQSDDRMESAGPLAGLRGVLPGDLGMIEQHTPPAFVSKIPVTDEQQARLSVLRALVEAEGQEQPLPAQKLRTNQLLLRLAVLALLVLVSVAALQLNLKAPLPTPEQIAPGVLAAQQLINTTPIDKPVLFVVDYEPGFADEMNTVVMPVLDHLVWRNVHLALVSTSSTGPIMSASLTAWINRQPAFENAEYTNYTNLGFLPGGANGIRAFALAPAQTLPSQMDGSPAWTGPLANVGQGLDEFGMVVVASDDPEGARQWIEQVGPLLENKTPLILLTSAQAGPVVQPYFSPETGLVSGLVSGMGGGADYYSLTKRASVVPLYWDAFSLALNGVVVFIVLGGFVSLVSSSITQRKAQKGEENT